MNNLKPDDFLQPDNPRFKEVYGHDPYAEKIKENKKNEEEKNQKKAELEKKYWGMKKRGELKPWEEKEVRRTVLHEENDIANKIIKKNLRRQ